MTWEKILKERMMSGSEWRAWKERSKKGNKGKRIHDQLKRIQINKNKIRSLEIQIEKLKSDIKDAETTIDYIYSRNEKQREAYELGDERKIGRLAPPEDLPPRDKKVEE